MFRAHLGKRLNTRGDKILQGIFDIVTKGVHGELHATRYKTRANIDKDGRDNPAAVKVETMPFRAHREFYLDLDLSGPLPPLFARFLPLLLQFADPPL